MSAQHGQRSDVLVISHDIVGPHMAGPGIRYQQLARVLSIEFDVVLASPGGRPSGSAPFRLAGYARGRWDSIAGWVHGARVALLPADLVGDFPEALNQVQTPLVIDGYDPLMAEWLAMTGDLRPDERQSAWAARHRALAAQCRLGDFYLCASERQRDWWLGALEAHGRVNPLTAGDDPGLRRLVDVVPFGLEAAALPAPRPVLRARWPEIGADDPIVLWGGGLWPWLDPLTAIHAVARLRPRFPGLRLVFPGTRHPNPAVADGVMSAARSAQALAEALGLAGQTVFFGDWVAIEDWPHVLQESTLALTLHGAETLESRLAFRSRVLDYIRAGLPIVATEGDVISDYVGQHRLGRVVACGDEAGVADAIAGILESPRAAWAEAFAAARAALTWEKAAEPLTAFCRRPHRAADRDWPMPDPATRASRPPARSMRPALRERLRRWLGVGPEE